MSNGEWPQPPAPDCRACLFRAGQIDPDYCDDLAYGLCRISRRPCPVVLRDGPTPLQLLDDVILALAGPMAAAWARKLKGD